MNRVNQVRLDLQDSLDHVDLLVPLVSRVNRELLVM